MNRTMCQLRVLLVVLIGYAPLMIRADDEPRSQVRLEEMVRVHRGLRGIKVADENQPVAEQLKRLEAQLNAVRLVGITYEILQVRDNQAVPRAVPPDRHEFTFGDKITLKLTSVVDAYLSLFYRDQQGNVVCLWPERAELAPRVEAGQVKILPYRGLEIGPPAGEDELIVVASLEPIQNLGEFARRLEQKPIEIVQQSDDTSKTAGEKPSSLDPEPKRSAQSTAVKSPNSSTARVPPVNPLDQLTQRTGPEQGFRISIDVGKELTPTSLARSERGLRAIYHFDRPTRGGGIATTQIAEVDRNGSEVFPFLIRLRTKAPPK